ncbi:uncharacterized protein LOC143544733 [Bidens hawaiensis]|uniref:uncharacterized protein LOC143544733 n=1 Tax=Bidens hawaiensis TaxID=980011 RepID=UPI0040494B77
MVNIRGIGDACKADWVRGLKTSNGVHFLAIQETKKINIPGYLVSRLWGKYAFEYDSVDAEGRSGGILSVWDPSYFRKVGRIIHRRFLVTIGEIRLLGCEICFVNVYAPNDSREKRSLWTELLGLRASLNGMVVFMGDFNEVRSSVERRNLEFSQPNANVFNDFIERAGLTEYQMGGGLFTYISDNGVKMS